MKLEKYKRVLANDVPPKISLYVRMSMDILDRINDLLKVKFNDDTQALANEMQVPLKKVENLLSGVKDFSIFELIEFEVAFDEPIFNVVPAEQTNLLEETRTEILDKHYTLGSAMYRGNDERIPREPHVIIITHINETNLVSVSIVMNHEKIILKYQDLHHFFQDWNEVDSSTK